jgi:hypothetical protein
VAEISDNLSVEEYISQRIASANEQDVIQEETLEEQPLEEEDLLIEGEEPEEGQQEEDIDEELELLLSRTPEEIQELAKRGKSGLLKRLGELTAKNKALSEKLLSKGEESKPLSSPIPPSQNPFSSLKTSAELRAKFEEMERVESETSILLDDHEDYASSDTIEFAGREFTKREIRTANRNARLALSKYLPAQREELENISQREELTTNYRNAIAYELPDLADETTEIGKNFKGLLEDPMIDQIRERVPQIAPQLDYLLAHAANSIFANRNKTAPKAANAVGTTIKPRLAGVPFGAGAPRNVSRNVQANIEELRKQFESDGSEASWKALKMLERSNS